jgi:hypothetical protein
VILFDEQSAGTHGIRRYDAEGNEGAQIHSEKRIRIRGPRKSRENRNRA